MPRLGLLLVPSKGLREALRLLLGLLLLLPGRTPNAMRGRMRTFQGSSACRGSNTIGYEDVCHNPMKDVSQGSTQPAYGAAAAILHSQGIIT